MEMYIIIQGILVGIVATITMDLWGKLLKILFNINGLNIALLGRWSIHLFKNKNFFHQNIVYSSQEKGENNLGWLIHYLIGIFFAIIFLLFTKYCVIENPPLLLTLIFGFLTLFAPFLVMQPVFGFGIAASKLPSPWVFRLKSLSAHLSYGCGIWIGINILRYVGL